jgi:hypothetical protein
MKHYYPLTASKSKHVMTALTKKQEKFFATLSILGGGEEIEITLDQYNKLYGKRDNIFHFFETGENFEHDFSDLSSHFVAKGKTSQCKMLELKHIDRRTKQVNATYIVKSTFEKLMSLHSLLFHNMYILEKNLEEINVVYANRDDTDFNIVASEKSENFDFVQFVMELDIYDRRGNVDFLNY